MSLDFEVLRSPSESCPWGPLSSFCHFHNRSLESWTSLTDQNTWIRGDSQINTQVSVVHKDPAIDMGWATHGATPLADYSTLLRQQGRSLTPHGKPTTDAAANMLSPAKLGLSQVVSSCLACHGLYPFRN